ncbi:hypothetical protein [Sphingobacterium gobiense]|uniref:Uncharacterized protein n=1 Tax=Sphingobacterium gobiense TaxID=1382456 RepID=A0A2S9JNJ6_9SPHI|nr:hypothetical protein [Sphingobacterium gobiense]PRD54740.1 hypothetical protein C5749_15010 [Sphingobacterium gobiense]
MNREKEIKSTITGAYEFKDEDGVIYKMKILGRGEELFFQKGDDAFICDISARFSVIDLKSISKWDNGKKISEEERASLLAKIVELYKKAYKDDLKL